MTRWAGRRGGQGWDGDPAGETSDRPLYARVLRLRHVRPSGLACLLCFEGALALGVLLALAEFVPWWGVPVVPATVAAMVKLNDVVAGAAGRRPPGPRRSTRPHHPADRTGPGPSGRVRATVRVR